MLKEMLIISTDPAKQIYLPSQFWADLNAEHLMQLETEGYDNFKRTIAKNYFWWSGYDHEKRLRSLISPVSSIRAYLNAVLSPEFPKFLHYKIFTYLLYEYAKDEIKDLEENKIGNPIRTYINKKLISQELINSALEYKSISERIEINKVSSIMEIGSGYGRTAYVFLKRHPNIEYTCIDLPPALWTCQKYLTGEFPSSKLKFLLPHEIEKIPDNSIDLTINISSFQEMTKEQIENYFEQIERTSKSLYIKEWIEGQVEGKIKRDEYPVGKSWRVLFDREIEYQQRFFEALYKVNKSELTSGEVHETSGTVEKSR